MKKIAPLFIVVMIIILIIPTIAFQNGQTQPNDINNQDTDTKNLPREKENDNEIKNQEDTRIYKILNHKTNEVMELTPLQYIMGVVAAEMPIEFQAEALKAQAVTAHTYALREISYELSNPNVELMGAFLTTDYTINQAYISDEDLKIKWGKNYKLNHKKLKEAVEPVINEVITLDDKPIIAAFHSLSNGYTESAFNVWGEEVTYLNPVKSEGDYLSPKFTTDTVLTANEVGNALLKAYEDIVLGQDKSTWLQVATRSNSNTVLTVKAGNIEISGAELRTLLGLKSATFEIGFTDDNFTFTTNGYGHGVGMSQYGADFLARQGEKYDEIIKHYYSGVDITLIDDIE